MVVLTGLSAHRIGEMWSKLPEAQKSAYQNRAAKAREQYQAALAGTDLCGNQISDAPRWRSVDEGQYLTHCCDFRTEYNANKKAAAKADAAAPAADALKKKKRRHSEDAAGEKKKRKKKSKKADKA